jgi:hypothetical protein
VTGNLSSGNTSYWRLDMINEEQDVLTVVEVGGIVYPLAYGVCADDNVTVRIQALTPAVVDSPLAGLSAWGDGGAGYASNHSGFVVDYGLGAGIEWMDHYFPPQWSIQYLVCSNDEVFTPGPGLQVTVNATSGSPVASQWALGGCPPTG